MKPRFVVKCADYTTKPTTRETAERQREHIEAFGQCHNEHNVEKVDDAE